MRSLLRKYWLWVLVPFLLVGVVVAAALHYSARQGDSQNIYPM